MYGESIFTFYKRDLNGELNFNKLRQKLLDISLCYHSGKSLPSGREPNAQYGCVSDI